MSILLSQDDVQVLEYLKQNYKTDERVSVKLLAKAGLPLSDAHLKSLAGNKFIDAWDIGMDKCTIALSNPGVAAYEEYIRARELEAMQLKNTEESLQIAREANEVSKKSAKDARCANKIAFAAIVVSLLGIAVEFLIFILRR